MVVEFLANISYYMVLGTIAVLYLIDDWKTSLVMVSLQFGGILFYLTRWIPIEQSIIYLISAWFSAAFIGMAALREGENLPQLTPGLRLNRIFIFLFMGISLFFTRTYFGETFDISRVTVVLSAMLIIFGMFIAFEEARYTRRCLGYLIMFSGFQLTFFTIDPSLLAISSQSLFNLLAFFFMTREQSQEKIA